MKLTGRVSAQIPLYKRMLTFALVTRVFFSSPGCSGFMPCIGNPNAGRRKTTPREAEALPAVPV